MSNIDLHIHTNYSNGKDDLIKVLKMAEANKISTISITDYNTLKAYIELRDEINISDYYSGDIVIGLEVRCKFKDENGEMICCDMLGYNMDFDKIDSIEQWLKENTGKDSTLAGQIQQLNYYKVQAEAIGLKFDTDLSLTPDNPKAGMVMINNILKYYEDNENIWNSIMKYPLSKYKEEPTSAWQEIFTQKGNPLYFNIGQYCPNLNDFMQIIHDSGGLVFAAHPYAYTSSNDKSEEQSKTDLETYLKLVSSLGVDGIEVYNQYNCDIVPYGLQASDWIFDFCKKSNLLISGGTDYHGVDPRHSGIGILGGENENAKNGFISDNVMEWISHSKKLQNSNNRRNYK